MKITIDDMRRCGICWRARFWFDRHGLGWRDFVKNGIDSSDLRATGDQLAAIARLEAAAKERGRQNG